MDEIECTAIVDNGEPTRHLLFTPPCACPRCAPEPADQSRAERDWLRLPGQAQRHRVEEVTFGATGRTVLG
ncbi:MAG: hypothetical protein AAFO29_18575 [Actinomycetota bacterium]